MQVQAESHALYRGPKPLEVLKRRQWAGPGRRRPQGHNDQIYTHRQFLTSQ